MKNNKKEHWLGKIVSSWNVEHTPVERQEHLRWDQVHTARSEVVDLQEITEEGLKCKKR